MAKTSFDEKEIAQAGNISLAKKSISEEKALLNQEFLDAFINDNTEKALDLLQNHPEIDLNYVDDFGMTALMLATGNLNEELIKKLLELKADVNAQDINGFTALFCIPGGPLTEQKRAIGQLLIDNGASIELRTDNGRFLKDLYPELVHKLTPKKHSLHETKEVFRKTISKLRNVMPVKDGSFDPDCVPVRMREHSLYIGEVLEGRQRDLKTGEFKFLIPPMNDEERNERKVEFKDGVLLDKEGLLLNTSNFKNKGIDGVQAFVLSKEGDLYLFNCDKPDRVRGIKTFYNTHGSVLGGKPAEMAGIMRVENGKIKAVAGSSGHYRPQLLDMYRALKVFQAQGVLAEDCTANTRHVAQKKVSATQIPPSLNGILVSALVSNLEQDQGDGIPLSKQLRLERIMDNLDYRMMTSGKNPSKFLAASGIDKDFKDSKGRTTLHHLCGSINGKKRLLYQQRINQLNEDQSALPIGSNESKVQAIILKREKYQAKIQEIEVTGLLAIKDLFKAGYKNSKDPYGTTPRDIAYQNGCLDIFDQAIADLTKEGILNSKPTATVAAPGAISVQNPVLQQSIAQLTAASASVAADIAGSIFTRATPINKTQKSGASSGSRDL